MQNIARHLVIAVRPKSKIKRKCKFVPVCVMKAYEVGGDLLPLILNLDTRLIFVVNFTPRPLYLRERIPVSTGDRLRHRVGPDGLWRENISCPCPFSNPRPSSPCLVAISTAITFVSSTPDIWKSVDVFECSQVLPDEKSKNEHKCGALVD